MKNFLRVVLGAAVASVLVTALAGWGVFKDGAPSFDVRPGKKMRVAAPAIQMTESEREDFMGGKPVCRLIDTEGEAKAGYMRLMLPYDPPTAWRIVTDVGCFDLQSAEFPKNGSLGEKRRTFMPYVFDSAHCTENGTFYLYQLLVLPFIDPRHFSLDRVPNRDGFPWETSWKQVPGLKCQSGWNKGMDKFRESAVLTERNVGAWHLSPLPKEFVKSKADLLKTDTVYWVDSNPGGNVGSMTAIVNKATKTALPALADSLLFLGTQFDAHMRKYHIDDLKEWEEERAAYKEAVGYEP
ncbi:MAG: hypothetical protein M5R36_27955 [Deltaproteobacteria bacterium]|nr:hypothetical protein [Deltaproteobacteria bacterium]